MTLEQKTYHAKRNAASFWQRKGASVILWGEGSGKFTMIVDFTTAISWDKAERMVKESASGVDAMWKRVRGSRLDVIYTVRS